MKGSLDHGKSLTKKTSNILDGNDMIIVTPFNDKKAPCADYSIGIEK
jgi:hypothetical protein